MNPRYLFFIGVLLIGLKPGYKTIFAQPNLRNLCGIYVLHDDIIDSCFLLSYSLELLGDKYELNIRKSYVIYKKNDTINSRYNDYVVIHNYTILPPSYSGSCVQKHDTILLFIKQNESLCSLTIIDTLNLRVNFCLDTKLNGMYFNRKLSYFYDTTSLEKVWIPKWTISSANNQYYYKAVDSPKKSLLNNPDIDSILPADIYKYND